MPGWLPREAAALGLKLLPVLAYCERVTVPTVVGVLQPMILLPVALASGLSPEQIETVLAHELAHLRRCDHLVNLLQRVIESLLFFHPAMWWVSHRVREEREHCCDDLVVACGAMPLDYAKSLLRVAELSRTGRGALDLTRGSVAAVSLLATGNQKPSNLRQRIERLLGESARPSLRISPRALLLAVGIPLIALLVTIRGGASKPQAAPADAPFQPGHKTDVKSSVGKTLGLRRDPFIATLPNGARVEFVGLAPMEEEPKTWWMPNGAPLKEVPKHGKEKLSVTGQDMRRALIRVHGGGLSYLDVITPGMTSVRSDEAHGLGGPFVRVDGGYAVPLGQTTARLEVGIATQPQSPVRHVNSQGRQIVLGRTVNSDNGLEGWLVAEDLNVDDIQIERVESPPLWISKSNGRGLPETVEQERENDQRRVQTQVVWSAPKRLRTFDLAMTLIDIDGEPHP
ncbi:MAG: M56 family metallopeptidase [Planctomycetota bacterium]